MFFDKIDTSKLISLFWFLFQNKIVKRFMVHVVLTEIVKKAKTFEKWNYLIKARIAIFGEKKS